MTTTINASTSAGGGLINSADASGILALQTAGVTAVTIDASQNVSFTNQPTYSGGTANGVLYLNGSKTATSGSALVFDGTNLGVGVTPSAWYTAQNTKVIQFGTTGALVGVGKDIFLSNNEYANTSGSDVYLTTGGAALQYRQTTGGQHQWLISPAGTAGNAITFTQAMTLDASGNLGVGTTSPNARLDVNAATGSNTNISVSQNGAVKWYIGNVDTSNAFRFYNVTGGAEAARIDSSGNFNIGTTGVANRLVTQGSTTTNTASAFQALNSAGTILCTIRNDGVFYTGVAAASPYNNTTASAANLFVASGGDLYRSTSSLKYKTDVKDATHGLAEVLKLRSVTYKGKTDGDTVFGGLIAEEVDEAGLTEFVQYAEDGTPDALAYGQMVSLLAKAIQEQQALITRLQADVAALKA